MAAIHHLLRRLIRWDVSRSAWLNFPTLNHAACKQNWYYYPDDLEDFPFLLTEAWGFTVETATSPTLPCCATEMGVDRILLSVNYPFVSNIPSKKASRVAALAIRPCLLLLELNGLWSPGLRNPSQSMASFRHIFFLRFDCLVQLRTHFPGRLLFPVTHHLTTENLRC